MIEYIREATVDRDMRFYSIAENFYEKMMDELGAGNYRNQSDDSVLFDAKLVGSEYSDLLILLIDSVSEKTKPKFGGNSVKSGYALGTYKQKQRFIVINNLVEGKPVTYNINKDYFIHEFIHYLDWKRSGGHKPSFSDKTTLEEYFNSPTEYNAYYQEAANFVVKMLMDDKILDKFKERYKNYKDFYEWMTAQVFDKNFIKYLNASNKVKLQKRVYNIYDKFFN